MERIRRCCIRRSSTFPDGKAKFHPINYMAPSEEMNGEFDLHLNNGRLLEHFEQGSMTYRTAGIKEITPENFVEVSPELAAERGIESGQYVHLTSAYGRVKVQVLVTDRVQGKQLYMPAELGGGAGEQADELAYRPHDAYAGVQGDGGFDDGAEGEGR